MLGLPFPAGPHLERLAAGGRPGAFDFPIAAGVPGLDFSFAGLKTALLYTVRDLGERGAGPARRPRRLLPAARSSRRWPCASSGRSSRPAWSAWRSAAAWRPTARCASGWPASGCELHVPERALCTDNAAMIGSAARWVTPLREFAEALRSTPTRRGRARAVTRVVTVYGRPGCHLCDEARAVLDAHRPPVRGGRHRGRRRAARPLSRAHPRHRARRRRALRLLRGRGRASRPARR